MRRRSQLLRVVQDPLLVGEYGLGLPSAPAQEVPDRQGQVAVCLQLRQQACSLTGMYLTACTVD